MTDIAKLLARATARLRRFPPQHDGRRFQVRVLNGGWQVYAAGLEHICECTRAEFADMIADALEGAVALVNGAEEREAELKRLRTPHYHSATNTKP